MAIKSVQTSIAITDPQNNVLAGGSITLDLSQSAILIGGGDVVPTRVTLPLDSTGKIASQPVNLWANDQLSPSGTTYHMRFFNSNNLQVADFGNISIIGAAPIDLSLLTPVFAGPAFSVTNVPFVVARINLTAQAANVGVTTLYAVPTSGAYRVSMYRMVSQAATVSSTAPSVNFTWTDPDFVGATTITSIATNSANTVATGALDWNGNFSSTVNAQAGTLLQYSASGYASSGATPMQFSLHLRVEFLG